MDKRKRRRDRLINLLPPIYTTQPQSSIVGKLLDAFAGALTELDDHLERALRDRWVDLANGKSPGKNSNNPSPLDLLGQGIDIRRESWEEDVELYRRRIVATSNVLTEGLTTPRSILSLTAIAFGTELCPYLIRRQDTTIGRGMRPGTLTRCKSCAGPPEDTCKFQDAVLMEAQLTDNPPALCSVRHGPLTHKQIFRVRSNSMYSDLPVLTLYANKEKNEVPVNYPALQNRRTREVILYAGTLAPGETLSIRSRLELADISPFSSYAKVGHHPWYSFAPKGKALLSGNNETGGNYVRDVSDRIYYLRGYVFDEARFSGDLDEPHFAALQKQIRTPKIQPGEVMWVYRGYTLYDIEALTGKDNIENRSEYQDLLDKAPEESSAGSVEVTLEWWTRPPATFRLRIPKTPAVRNAVDQGTADLLKQSVEIARAAGVYALIDLPEPTRLERHSLSERFFGKIKTTHQEEAGPGEKALRIQSKVERKEHQQVEDVFAIKGIFDVTRFGWTRLAP